MNRRQFLKSAATAPLIPMCGAAMLTGSANAAAPKVLFRRVRPGDAAWPSQARWDGLKRAVEGRLIPVESPLTACQNSPDSVECKEVLKRLHNPFYVGDQPALTQTSGWLDAWTSAPSVYAVAAEKTADVVAAVNFARENHLRLVVRGGGHSYKGTSNSRDSLLIWTRAMNHVQLHDAFVPQGCAGKVPPQPAVSAGAGAIWLQLYHAVTTQAGRYVQGGGCTTVGVAGFIQGGGFGSFSKRYGLGAAGLLEAEIVTADGQVRIANACTNPDLFWGLKGGGAGSFGVVTRLTLRTRELPEYFGGVFGRVQAKSDAAFRRLVARVVSFYHERLFNPHWGEQIVFEPDNSIRVEMVFQGLSHKEAEEIWRPLSDWVSSSPQEFAMESPLRTLAIPARHFWDAQFLKQHLPEAIVTDDRSGAREGSFLWKGDQGQCGFFIHHYRSVWMPSSLLEKNRQSRLVDALVAGSRHWGASLHFNKGLAGARSEELAAAKVTAMNPTVLDAFALAIVATGGPPVFAGFPGPKPDLVKAREDANAINQSMTELLKVTGEAGAYVAESDYFERSWQRSFWGSNHGRLAALKKKYDPADLFFVHHGISNAKWSVDGFERLT